MVSGLETGRNNASFPQAVTRGGATRIIMPAPGVPPPAPEKAKTLKNPHEKNGTTFGVVYANDRAKTEIEKDTPDFPVGAIIVREKHLSADSETPETVIAMVKREKGFSKKTGDWEFFTFSGADLKMQRRETRGDCAKCHIQAEKTDWVFRDYLKK